MIHLTLTEILQRELEDLGNESLIKNHLIPAMIDWLTEHKPVHPLGKPSRRTSDETAIQRLIDELEKEAV